MTSFRFLSSDNTTNVEILTDLIGYSAGSENFTVCQLVNQGTTPINAAGQAIMNNFMKVNTSVSAIKAYAVANNLKLEVISIGKNAAKVFGSLFIPTTLARVVISATQINLTWVKSADATGYIIERATNAGFTTGVVNTTVGDVAALNVTGLVTATSYWFRIKALGVGCESAKSASVTGTTS